jgi:hypothetical protein
MMRGTTGLDSRINQLLMHRAFGVPHIDTLDGNVHVYWKIKTNLHLRETKADLIVRLNPGIDHD